MRISDHTAKMIVEKLKDVIDYDLNFLTKKDILFILQIQIELHLSRSCEGMRKAKQNHICW